MTDNSVLQARARFWKVAGASIAALVVLSTAGTNLNARHEETFVATDLETLGDPVTCPQCVSEAFAVNDKGLVVGRSMLNDSLLNNNPADVFHAFVWSEKTGMSDLGTLGGAQSTATAITSDGVIAGFGPSAEGALHAFVRTRLNFVDLSTLGGSTTTLKAINAKGEAVGSSDIDGDGAFHAFLWTKQHGMLDLGTLGGRTSTANAISDDGVVVGQSDTAPDPNNAPHAFMWTRHGGMVDLGTLVGGLNSTAQSVNNDGVVVGSSDTMSGVSHAVVWTRRALIIDLGKLVELDPGKGEITSFGDKINGRFVIFHTSTNTETSIITRSFVWTQRDGVVDIGTLGGDRSLALDVTESGVVVGGSSTAEDVFHAFVWSASTEKMVPLKSGVGTSQANGINGDFIVGTSCDGQNVCHATLWKPSSHSHHQKGDDDDQN